MFVDRKIEVAKLIHGRCLMLRGLEEEGKPEKQPKKRPVREEESRGDYVPGRQVRKVSPGARSQILLKV